jgi:hypothetical protein
MTFGADLGGNHVFWRYGRERPPLESHLKPDLFEPPGELLCGALGAAAIKVISSALGKTGKSLFDYFRFPFAADPHSDTHADGIFVNIQAGTTAVE